MEIHREFSSWYEYVTCVADPSLRRWKRGNASHDTSMGKWAGTQTFAEAEAMAIRTGWPEGRKLLTASYALVLPQPKPYMSQAYDVAGIYPCVPIYCSGDPACMVEERRELVATRPIVRIDYNNYVSASVSAESIMLRGAAILSLAEMLEHRGYSTELRVIGNCKSGKYIFRSSIVYKRAGDLLDLDSAAFAIAHPASLRRLAFALIEQHAEIESSFDPGYGSPLHQPNDRGASTIFVPGSTGHETPKSARRAVAQAAKALLEQQDLGEMLEELTPQ